VNGVPLLYIMCNNDEPREVGIEYAIEHQSLVVTTPLKENDFEVENSMCSQF
jgi:hypothetical protein